MAQHFSDYDPSMYTSDEEEFQKWLEEENLDALRGWFKQVKDKVRFFDYIMYEFGNYIYKVCPQWEIDMSSGPSQIIEGIKRILKMLEEQNDLLDLEIISPEHLGSTLLVQINKQKQRLSNVIDVLSDMMLDQNNEMIRATTRILELEANLIQKEIHELQEGQSYDAVQNDFNELVNELRVSEELQNTLLEEVKKEKFKNKELQKDLLFMQEKLARSGQTMAEEMIGLYREVELNEGIKNALLKAQETSDLGKEDCEKAVSEWTETIRETFKEKNNEIQKVKQQAKSLDKQFADHKLKVQNLVEEIAGLDNELLQLETQKQEKNEEVNQLVEEMAGLDDYVEELNDQQPMDHDHMMKQKDQSDRSQAMSKDAMTYFTGGLSQTSDHTSSHYPTMTMTSSGQSYNDSPATIVNVTPKDDNQNAVSLRKTLLMTSPKREKPLFCNIDVTPLSLTETENGDHFACDITVSLQPSQDTKRDQAPPMNRSFDRSVSPMKQTFESHAQTYEPSPVQRLTFDRAPEGRDRKTSPHSDKYFVRSRSPMNKTIPAVSKKRDLHGSFFFNKSFDRSPSPNLGLKRWHQRGPYSSRRKRFDSSSSSVTERPYYEVSSPKYSRSPGKAFSERSQKELPKSGKSFDKSRSPVKEKGHKRAPISAKYKGRFGPWRTTFDSPPQVTPTSTRRHGQFTPKGIFKKRHWNVRSLFGAGKEDPISPPHNYYWDKTMSWEEGAADHEHPPVILISPDDDDFWPSDADSSG